MSARFLVKLTLIVAAFSGAAFAQAAAESVLLNGASATSATKVGSALGNAQNKAAGTLGNRLAGALSGTTQQSRPVATTTVFHPPSTSRTKPAGNPPANGNFVASIKGGAPVCSTSAPDKAATAPAGTQPEPCTSGQPATTTKPSQYKSVVTVTFPK